MFYVKKPVKIEAIKYTGTNLVEIKDFFKSNSKDLIIIERIENSVFFVDVSIKTLEGIMSVAVDDYIIKGIKGEFYPCKPDIFEASYSKVC